MKVLIIGMGFSGTMFMEAFNYLSKFHQRKITLAYTSRNKKKINLSYYPTVKTALNEFKPDLVVIAVNDENHGEVLQLIDGYNGFVICEKPLADPNFNLDTLKHLLGNTSGFCLNMVARYSEAARLLKNYVEKNKLQLIRANFLWEKNRINDYRPTTGVISEIIHSLDLVQWINFNSRLELKHIQGVKSDFSISGDNILDSVSIVGEVNGATITGYSSFVNLFRRRELDFVFINEANELIFAQLTFDTPSWYEDSLKVWQENADKSETILEFNSLDENFDGDRKLERIVNVVKEITDFIMFRKDPQYGMPDINDAIYLQKLLNKIISKTNEYPIVKYNRSQKRVLLSEQSSFNRLG